MSKKKKNNIKGPLFMVALFAFAFVVGIFAVYFFSNVIDTKDVTPLADSGSSGDEYSINDTIPVESNNVPSGPMLVIVLDDFGQDIKKLRAIEDIGVPINIAVIPNLPYSATIAHEASLLGWDVLLHMPMEPKDVANHNPGPDVLLTTMTKEDMLDKLRQSLDAVPFIMGINNHMGSKFTEDKFAMRTVLEELSNRGLVFLDSKTSADSIAAEVAKELEVPVLVRNIFLDNEQDKDYILGQLEKAKKRALKSGYAIAIGHPHDETIEVLKENLPLYKEEGLIVVSLSSMYNEKGY